MFRYAYLHGFASSALSRKGIALATRFKEEHGIELERPDLNAPSFARLTYDGALGVLDGADEAAARDGQRWRLIGSSMGGYLAARWAELHPGRVDRLVLLCPGFNMAARWNDVYGRETMEQWQREGELLIPDAMGEPTAVHYALLEGSLAHPAWPEVPCPTVIIHGRQDAVVPIECSRSYAAARTRVQLVEVDDDHSLMASLDTVGGAAYRAFDLLESR